MEGCKVEVLQDPTAISPKTWYEYAANAIKWCISHGGRHIEVQPCITAGGENHFMLLSNATIPTSQTRKETIDIFKSMGPALGVNDFVLVTQEFEYFSCSVEHVTNSSTISALCNPTQGADATSDYWRDRKNVNTHKFISPKSIECKPNELHNRMERFLKASKQDHYLIIILKIEVPLNNADKDQLAQQLYDTFVYHMFPTPLSHLDPLSLKVHNLSKPLPYRRQLAHVKEITLNDSWTLIARIAPRDADASNHIYFIGQHEISKNTTFVLNTKTKKELLQFRQSEWLFSDSVTAHVQTFLLTDKEVIPSPMDLKRLVTTASDEMQNWANSLKLVPPAAAEAITSNFTVYVVLSNASVVPPKPALLDDDPSYTESGMNNDTDLVDMTEYRRQRAETTVTDDTSDSSTEGRYPTSSTLSQPSLRSIGKRLSGSTLDSLRNLCDRETKISRKNTICKFSSKIIKRGLMPADWITTLFDDQMAWKASYTEFYANIHIITHDVVSEPVISESDVTVSFMNLLTNTTCPKPLWLEYKVCTDAMSHRQMILFYKLEEYDIDELDFRITLTVQHPKHQANEVIGLYHFREVDNV